MADLNNINDLLDALGDLRAGFNDTAQELRDYQLAQQYVENKRKESLDKFTNGIRVTANELTNFSRTVISSNGSFASLNTAINLGARVLNNVFSKFGSLGKILGAVTDALATVATFVVEQFDEAYRTFEQLSGSGVVQSFEQLRESSQSLGLMYGDTAQLLSKYSKDLTLLGKSAVGSRQALERYTLETTEARGEFLKLGIGVAEFRDFQTSYILQMSRATRGQIDTVDNLSEKTLNYVSQLDLLSKLTGAQRKDIQEAREKRYRDIRFREGIATLQNREQIEGFMDLLEALAPPVAEGIKDFIATGILPPGAAQKTLLPLMTGGLDMDQLRSGLRSGSLDMFNAFQMVVKASGLAADQFSELANITAGQNILSENQLEFRELSEKGRKITREEADKLLQQQKQQRAETKSQTASLADSRLKLYESGRRLQLLATESDFATKAINRMATGIDWLTSKIYELAGKEMPPYLKAITEESKAREESERLTKELNEKLREAENLERQRIYQQQLQPGSRELSPEEIQNRIQRAQAGIKSGSLGKEEEAARRAFEVAKTRREGMQVSRAGASAAGYTREDLANLGFPLLRDDIQRAGAYLSPNLIELAKQVRGMPGVLGFTGFADKFHMDRNSKHNEGLAFDFVLANRPSKEIGEKIIAELKAKGASVALDEYNNPSPGSTGGHIHAEVAARLGGVYSGDTSGFPATLHGTEAVVPLPDGRTIPVTIKNPESMFSGFNLLASKIDTMIDLLQVNNRIQDNMFRNLA